MVAMFQALNSERKAKISEKEAKISEEKAKISAVRSKNAKAAAQEALTRSFVRTIGVSEKDKELAPDERAALWELAELDPANEPVREKVIDHWFQTEESVGRALKRQAQGLHAAVGLNLAVRNHSAAKATEMVERQGIDATPGLNAAASAALEPKDVASVADRLAKALENPKQEIHGEPATWARRWQR